MVVCWWRGVCYIRCLYVNMCTSMCVHGVDSVCVQVDSVDNELQF